MGAVINASTKEVTVRAFGKYFTFKPKQIKLMEDKFSRFIAQNKGYLGFAELSEELASDPEAQKTPEGKKQIQAALEQGIAARVKYLKSLIFNEEVSLQQDLDMKGIKASASAFNGASDCLENSYAELVGYQKQESDIAAERAKRVEELKKQLNKVGG